MVERSVCPHCSFRNFSVSKTCARCEKPLGHPEAKAESPPARPPAQRPEAFSRRTTAPLSSPPPAVRRQSPAKQVLAPRAPPPPAAGRPVSMAEGPKRPAYPAAPTQPPLRARAIDPAGDEADAATRIGMPLPPPAPAPASNGGPTDAHKPPVPPAAPAARAAEGPKKRRTSKPLVPARLWQHALAALVDAALVIAVGALWGAFEMLVKGGGWPSAQATFLESLAVWLHIYSRTTKRVVALMALFCLGHTIYGVRTGKTCGRVVCGLLLIGTGSGRPTKGGTWGATLWHATGGILSIFTLGAGHFWMLVDSQRRTWANVLGRTLVVQNAKRQGAVRP